MDMKVKLRAALRIAVVWFSLTIRETIFDTTPVDLKKRAFTIPSRFSENISENKKHKFIKLPEVSCQ